MDDFISEKCRVNPEATTPKSMVYAAYEHFCKKRGACALARSRFFTRLYQTVDDTAPARRRTKTGLKWCVAGLEIKPAPVVAITG